ncbi:hypothetical protein [Puerhibacterium sp. TATVAM-FAB25]|uniref:hypothetical protein n=1 Tax=Puerhibacterium sp. TATVAM-FAB25 TaxID=3093699 RepID=UPI00397A7357
MDRRSGYTVSLLVNAALLYLVNVRPGWQAVPFLTSETVAVLDAVNLTLIASLVTNAIYLVVDPPWLRALGDLVVAVIGLLALVALWRVFPFDLWRDFPFDLAGQAFDWALVARVLLVLGSVGTVVAILAALVRLVAGLTAGSARTP